MYDVYAKAQDAALFIKSKFPQGFSTPKAAIICGTGLGGIANILETSPKIEIPYEEIPGFMVSTGKNFVSMNALSQFCY